MYEDTIVTISTGKMAAAIGIVRMSGVKSLEIISKMTNKKLIPRVASLCHINDSQNEILDEAICIYFKSPFSFTGEDIIEIQSHGGIVILDSILKTCIHFGARLARSGEFSKRAVFNGKIDVLKLDSIIQLINSKNKNLNKALAKNIRGDLHIMLTNVRLKINKIIAQIEVNIDYADENLDEKILTDANKDLDSIILDFQEILKSSKSFNDLNEIKLSIIGRPNVGKSSIMNALLMDDRVITSDIAGTTRDVITEYININGSLIQIADTAGIRNTKDKLESIGIEKSFKTAKNSNILLCVFDSSEKMNEDDFRILDFVKQFNGQVLIIINKIDKKSDDFEFKNQEFKIIKMNALIKIQSNKIKDELEILINKEFLTQNLLLTNIHSQEILKEALTYLKSGKMNLKEGQIEISSLELTNALKTLGEITKPYNVEEMLDSMFSQFCVGK